EKVAHKCSPGIDRINKASFEKRLDEYTNIISRKVLNGTYEFIPYKEKLISKGYGKSPRQISIPSIRDKVTLCLLNEILTKSFENEVSNKIIQTLVDELKQEINSYNYNFFIKIDIKEFFSSISHPEILKLISKRIRKKSILELIEKAIKTPTLSFPTKETIDNKIGIPQGISIASILANIYLSDIDKTYSIDNKEFKYFRYVDDILILCNDKNYEGIRERIFSKLKALDLSVSCHKYKESSIYDGFSYLGYSFEILNEKSGDYGFTVRKESVKKFEDSLVKIFSEFKFSKNKNSEKFLWRINKKITGCIFDKSKYGWLFFYSQIDDLPLLYHLDWFIQKLCDQFEIDNNIRHNIKRFVRTFHEVKFNLNSTNYIPNF
ncbi:reverse transcriptase domain-containing protein, partial [Saccharibacillus sacchari]